MSGSPRTDIEKDKTDCLKQRRIESSCDDFALLLGSGLYFVAGPANIDPGTRLSGVYRIAQ
jgi:hypothetical protein